LLASERENLMSSLNVSFRLTNKYGAKSDTVIVMVLRVFSCIIVANM
jgi:hypothetical protein